MRPLLFSLLFLALLSSAAADCTCPKNGTIELTPLEPAVLHSNPTTNGKISGTSCSASCNLTVFTKDSTLGIRANLLSTLSAGQILVLDGSTYLRTINKETPTQVFPTGAEQSMTFVFTEAASDNTTFMLSIDTDKHGVAPVTVASTLPPTLPPYTGNLTGLVENPAKISVDLMIGIDCSGDDVAVTNLRDLALALIGQLNVQPEADEGLGTRVAAHMLTPYDGFIGQIGVYWVKDGASVQAAIKALAEPLGASKKSQYKYITSNIVSAFNTSSNRTTAERVYVLFSASGPADKDTSVEFAKYGIHPILVTTGMGQDISYFNDYTEANKWSILNVSNAGPYASTALVDLLNGFFFTAKNKPACLPAEVDIDLKGEKNISVPLKYAGLPSGTSWETDVHYCNFQNTEIAIKNNNATNPGICLTFYFETEPDTDTITIFDGDRRVAKLSGYDIKGVVVQIKSAAAKIVFATDEKNVYDGFQVIAAPGQCPPGQKIISL